MDNKYKKENLHFKMLDKFMIMLENFDMYTRSHCLRVGIYTGLFFEYLDKYNLWTDELLKLSDDTKKDILYSSFVHDIGKTTILIDTINKNNKLTEEEWQDVLEHPQSGAFFFSTEEYRTIRNGVLMHHERYDGNGYPLGIKGKDISVGARVISIIDSFDAMTDKRPYISSDLMTLQQALDEIEKCSGTQFDPMISDLFVCMCKTKEYSEILKIKEYPQFMEDLGRDFMNSIKKDNFVLLKKKDKLLKK